jgi:pimeloyl-ACP methyl ester carboxylesterase
VLADRYLVITYDRRGYSRSPLEHPVDDTAGVPTDADDAHLLLHHLTTGPAHVFGSCSGAIVALALLMRHPDQMRMLVAHEPPLASVLPDAAYWQEFYAGLHATYRSDGIDAAKQVFRAHLGLTGETRPPKDAELPADRLAQMLARIRGNQEFWWDHEMQAYPAFVPDIAALRLVSDQLVLAVGSESREDFPYRPNAMLAELLGIKVTDFPGGHVGHVTHPAEFAATLAGILATPGG